jgi:stage II sporulation protein D
MMERFSLPSPAFTLTVTASGAKFSCKGKGTGKGMSLYGANELAKQGKNFRELLATFYPTATLQEANRSLGSK